MTRTNTSLSAFASLLLAVLPVMAIIASADLGSAFRAAGF